VSSSIAVEKLKQTCIAEWNLLVDYNNNKFIAEMANDSLPVQKFIFYLKQDHAFLKEFCSFLLRLSDAVEDPSLKRWLEGLHQSTEQQEMLMQKQLLVSLGLSEEDIETMIPAGATKNYISFLRKISASTSIEEKVSAVVPCPWSYLQITLRMLTSCTENKIRNKVYQRWVEFYASQESHQQVEYLKGVLGQLYFNADKAMKLIMERSFSAACLQEYSFWKMAYNIEVTEP
jgi:thiaminase/transcriptional activator TenA